MAGLPSRRVHPHRVRKAAPALPGVDTGNIAIPIEDGSELSTLTATGRHLRTLNTLTGAVLTQFTYDPAGRLSAVTDGDGNVTTVERDAQGSPTAILAPFGQRTLLTLDSNG